MTEKEKQLYIREQIDKIKGSEVIGLETRREGDVVLLETIKLRHPNGSEFVVRPFDWRQLHVVQTLWWWMPKQPSIDLSKLYKPHPRGEGGDVNAS